MGRNTKWQTTTETVAIGIEGDRHSLCGAIKRFESDGFQWNGLRTLKEQCARRIARIKNEQIKWFISSWLPPDLFKYATKDIFDLHRIEFVLNYPKKFYMCEECSMDTYESPPENCQCPNIDAAIEQLNKRLFKPSKKKIKSEKPKHFKLIYKRPNDEESHEGEEKHPASCFLYLSPTQHCIEMDTEDGSSDGAFDEYTTLNGQISVENKLLFVDTVRLFGGFRIKQREPQLILYRRREFDL